MGVIPKGAKSNQEPIAAPWMRKAIENSRARNDEGYLAPLHIKHHGFGVETKRAGFFRLTRVGLMRYEGEDLPAVFADFIRIPEDVFATIERGEVPYRSVEIHDWRIPEIDSLALLEDEVPFFRLELLTVGKKIAAAANGTVEAHFFAREPVGQPVAVLVSDVGGAALFQMEDSPMTTRIDIDPVQGVKLQDKEDEKEMKAADDDEKKKDDDDTPKWAKAFLSKLDRALSLLGEKEPVEAAAKAEDDKSDEDTAPVDLSAKAKDEKEIVTLSATVAALTSRLDARDQKDAASEKTCSIVASLVGEGYHVDEASKESIATVVEKGDEALADEWVKVFKLHASKEPPTTLEGLEMNLSGKEPDEVLKFSKDPKDLEVAVRSWREFQELRAAGHLRDIPLERHLELAVERERALVLTQSN
jgi:hypothetical protein